MKCSVTLKEIGYEHDLEAQTTLDTIVDRLPSYTRTKWVDKANEKRKRDERAGFDTLREFIIEEHSRICAFATIDRTCIRSCE